MKKLFAVLLAVAMLLSLGVTAFAVDEGGKILIADPPADTMYKAFKVFDVDVVDDAMTYTIAASGNPFKDAVMDTAATGADSNGDPYNVLNPKSLVKGLEFKPMTAEHKLANNPADVTYYEVKRTSEFSAADLANQLKATAIANAASGSNSDNPYTDDDYKKTGSREITVTKDGYYLILAAGMTVNDHTGEFDSGDVKAPAALTTVFGGNEVQIQAKHDMPLDKTVDDADTDTDYDDDGNGVHLGDKLNYKIEAKLPADPQNENYIYYFSDTMSDGLTFGNKLTIKVGDPDDPDLTYEITYKPKDVLATTPVAYPTITVTRDPETADDAAGPLTFELVTDPEVALEGNQVRFGANGKTWELSLDVASQTKDDDDNSLSLIGYKGEKITIEYDATVNKDAVAEVLENKVVLVFGEDNEHTEIKDDSTKNYDSAIVIDKFAEGNNSQKLKDAEFVLYRRNPLEKTDGSADLDEYGNQKYAKEYYQLKATGKSQYVDSFDDYYFQTVAFKDGKLDLTEAQKAALYTTKDGKLVPKFKTIELNWIAVTDENVIPYSNLDDSEDENTITKVVTDVNGAAMFGYLPDSSVAQNTTTVQTAGANTPDDDTDDVFKTTIDTDGYYYLYETKAPVDYTRLLQPVQIVVDGSASVDPSMTQQQQDQILTNIANISNVPGSTLPSTGGVGATLLTIGGIALMLAAGAFLVLRRRKEQE